MDEHFAGKYFDRHGQSITWREYADLVKDIDYKIVARTVLGDLVITTAWLGSDQGWWGDGVPPLIFGTIVSNNSVFVDASELFSATEDSARVTHALVVASASEQGPYSDSQLVAAIIERQTSGSGLSAA